jgi:hypothetical protein
VEGDRCNNKMRSGRNNEGDRPRVLYGGTADGGGACDERWTRFGELDEASFQVGLDSVIGSLEV